MQARGFPNNRLNIAGRNLSTAIVSRGRQKAGILKISA